MIKKSQRVIGIDILRVFCVFFVICLHTEILNSVFGINFEPVSRFAVPCFFMISGFFYRTTVKRKKEFAQIKKVIMLIIVSNAAMILLNFVYYLSHNKSVVKWFFSLFSFSKILNCLVFNVNFVTGYVETAHLWYLNALLYVLIIAAVLRKLGAFKVLYYLTPVLLAGGLIVECFSEQIFGVNFSETKSFFYYRNFLTVGIPYFCIGNLLNTYQHKLKVSNFLLLIMSAFFIALSVFEMCVSNYLSLSSNGEFFLTTPFCSVCVFLFFMRFFESKNNRLLNVVSVIGKKYVVWIYVFQYPIIIIIRDFLTKYVSALNSKAVITVLTLAVSLFVAVITDKVMNIVKYKIRSK